MTDPMEFVRLARAFGEGELRPHSERWEQDRALPDELMPMLAETGFLGMTVPEEHGGLGLDPAVYGAILQELAWADPSVGLSVAVHEVTVHHLLRRGDEALCSEWLPKATTGEAVLTFALHEPEAGTDPGAFETAVEGEGDDARVTGRKDWVSNGLRADGAVVFGRDGATEASVLVDPAAEGYSAAAIAPTMGLKALETVSVALDGAPGRRIGSDPPGRHDAPLRHMLRLSLGAVANGIAVAALEHAVRYATEREQFGRALSSFGAIRDKLGTMRMRIDASRALTGSAFERYGSGADAEGADSIEALTASVKVTAADAALLVADEAVQIFGGYGYMRDYPVEKLMRDAHGVAVLGGTGGALRAVVARELLTGTE